MQSSALCRSRRELSNAYFLAKFGLDTAENEPCQVCPIEPSLSLSYFQMYSYQFIRVLHLPHVAHELLALGRELVEAVVLHVIDVEGALAGGLLDAHRRAGSGAVQLHGADLARDNSADLGARAESLASPADLPVGILGLQSTIRKDFVQDCGQRSTI